MSPGQTTGISKSKRAFSLVEMLVVVGIAGALLALAGPALLNVSPSRKTTVHELAGTLQFARSEAVSRQKPVFVAFADIYFPDPAFQQRSYALFVSTEEDPQESDLRKHSIRQISPWHTLPEGVVFAHGLHFEAAANESFATLFESSSRREFSVTTGSEPATQASLPFLAFGENGEVLAPEFYQSNTLHLGIAEGFFDGESGRYDFTGMQPGVRGGEYPRTECLHINFYTGNVRIITD